MKINQISYIVFFLLNAVIAISCYFYPITRDEFYYINARDLSQQVGEYLDSYNSVNPRIGQFFTNVISSNKFLEVVFGVLLFNAFISILFLYAYKRFPQFKNRSDVSKYLVLAAIFIFLINYFGEMFYYTPFSGNYTFTHLFYLLFVYYFVDYYVYQKDKILKKGNYFIIIGMGFFIGMGNEHVPPDLLLMSLLGAFFYVIKNKKLPNLLLLLTPLAIFFGYLLLWTAPANKVREMSYGAPVAVNNISAYFENIRKIFEYYYHYNSELIFVIILISIILVVQRKKVLADSLFNKQLLLYISFAILPLFVVGFSPLIGTRLLFFSTTLLIIILLKLLQKFDLMRNTKKYSIHFSLMFLAVFITFNLLIIEHANENFERVMSELSEKKKMSDHVVMENSFDYFHPNFGFLNRKILLENGSEYLDNNSSEDTTVERLLKNYYKLESIKTE